ncbi:type III secretion system export apparatus subunit SctT [Pseudomonas gingeri]|uniref:type III secretion system export apparatus subunit SctT n=1 Tax=Pseudomonas gingeri TaxID=117681 RepID=UPI0015A221D4|nr:type III secretion system export apparatus subunit SctT [Pseudomonas gingeri]NVZ99859.1 SpaR/YscT/HrcT type III secretion system export apparatus protein [Pseudomonas gingeri]NWA16699.1 SpaR/YscT/HrcT type III secretion system export apparatus protein [Pseudomonas gingeri]NWA53915.1 SpaR/YscT/HrcT type III secretion system export apparatus protein [Pseudomonas gingeri]NWA94147.1 SpaR/YscT/HrcT type III secretion system export apparatus protein [Pseudomonas gingeri]NWB01953.1 SpaR/YscT/HrcT 
MSIVLFFELHAWLAAALVAFARLAPIFFMLPFLNSGVLTGVPRQAVIILVALGFWPAVGLPLPALDSLAFFGLLLREVGIGVLLGCLLCWPFWVLHGVGNLIDNQRGAMLSNTVDPANGVDTSELANFLQLFAAAVYLEGGGMLLMVETVARSYQLCPPTPACATNLASLPPLLDGLVGKILVISAPVVAALLISEALLGLLSRYAPQMNAFSVSLTVKSLVALVVLMLYFGVHLPDEVLRMGRAVDELAVHMNPPMHAGGQH